MEEDVVVAPETESTPTPEMENEVFSFQVEDQVAQETAPDPNAELQAQIAALQAQVQATSAPVAQAPIDYAELAKTIAAASKPAAPQAPQLNLEELISSTDPDFYKSPSASVYKLMEPILVQQQEAFAKQMADAQFQTSQALATGSDANKELFADYGEEITQIAGTMKGADAYQKAIDQVKTKHMDDIIAKKTAAQVEALVAEKLAEALKPKEPAPFTNAGSMSTAKPGPVRITPADKRKLDHWMLVKGFNVNDPEDQEFAYTMLKEGRI